MIHRRQVLLAAAALGLAGCGSSIPGPQPAQAQTSTLDPDTQLFVINAEGGTLSGGLLTLTGVHSDTIWFDDRPARHAGRETTGQFVADWAANGFAQVPPNALLQAGSGSASQALVLQDPNWDEASSTLTFRVSAAAGVAVQFPSSFGPSALFIDSAAGATGAPTAVSAPVQILMTPGGSVTVRLIPQGVPIRFGSDPDGFIFYLEDDASGFKRIVLTDLQEITVDMRSGSCGLLIDLVTTSDILNFGIVQVGGAGPVRFQGRQLQKVPTILPWAGTVQ
jgi:hypothetical protein